MSLRVMALQEGYKVYAQSPGYARVVLRAPEIQRDKVPQSHKNVWPSLGNCRRLLQVRSRPPVCPTCSIRTCEREFWES